MKPRTAPRELSGDLGLLSLFDLCQTLALNAATGTLRLESDAGKGYLHFESGVLINGLDERQREGEKAARTLFTWKEAHFSFQSGPVSAACVIEMPTQSFLLDIAREQDEASAHEPSGGPGKVEKLRQHEALKLAFAKIARDSSAATGPSASAEAERLLQALAAVPGGEVLLRAGRPAMSRQAGGWRPMGEGMLSHDHFDELLRILSPPGSVLVPGQVSLPRATAGAQLWAACGEDLGGTLLSVRCLHSSAPPVEAVELSGGLQWVELFETSRVEVLGARGAGKSFFLAAAARAAAESGYTVGWGGPDPASAMTDPMLPLRYISGGPLSPDAFAQLALRVRCDVVFWDGPASSLPRAVELPDWGTGLFVAGPGLPSPRTSLVVSRAEAGRIRIQPA